MNFPSISGFEFLIFVIPGFITVWAFRYFTKSKKTGDFEYLGLSFFWGLIMLLIFELIGSEESIKKLLQNYYATAIVLSLFGFIFGWLGSIIPEIKILINLIKKKIKK